MTKMASPKIRLAILDDYQSIAAQKLAHLSSRVEVTSFSDTLNATTDQQQLIERLQPFEVIATMRERTALPETVIKALSNLKLVLTTGMKNTAIDMEACAKRGIPVVGAKGLGGLSKPPTSLDSTLQHTWALILGIARNIARDDALMKTSNGWETSFATGLTGKTLGVIGLGKLGADVSKVAVLAFGMKVLAWSSSLTQEAADEKAKSFGLPAGAFQVASSKEHLLRDADVVTIHYVLSDRSYGMLGSKELQLLKPTALLVNTSRGPLIDEQALLETVKAGRIKGLALDVYHTEPLPASSEWRSVSWGKEGRSEVLLSPHMGYVEEGVMSRWYEDSFANLEAWLDGKDLPTKLN